MSLRRQPVVYRVEEEGEDLVRGLRTVQASTLKSGLGDRDDIVCEQALVHIVTQVRRREDTRVFAASEGVITCSMGR
jgi:hypothetical protein